MCTALSGWLRPNKFISKWWIRGRKMDTSTRSCRSAKRCLSFDLSPLMVFLQAVTSDISGRFCKWEVYVLPYHTVSTIKRWHHRSQRGLSTDDYHTIHSCKTKSDEEEYLCCPKKKNILILENLIHEVTTKRIHSPDIQDSAKYQIIKNTSQQSYTYQFQMAKMDGKL